MLAEQGKFRFCMIEIRLFPILFCVALFAFFTFLALMLIVSLMAVITSRR